MRDSNYLRYLRIKQTVIVTVQVNRDCLLTVTWPVLSRHVANARAATSSPQHCWGHVCLPARPCTSTLCSWHSRAFALWDTPVHQSWHVACQHSWPKPGWLLHLGHDAGACIPSTNPQCARVVAAACISRTKNHTLPYFTLPMGREHSSQSWGHIAGPWAAFQHSMVNDAINQRWKDWKRVSMQMVVNMNTCCDVACLTYKLSHNTTGSFQSHQHLEGTMYLPSDEWVLHSTRQCGDIFRVWWATSQSWLQFILFWGNVNNQKCIWIILLKNHFLDFSRYSAYCVQVRWANL